MLSPFIIFFSLFFMEMYRDQNGEFVCRYWGLKGLNSTSEASCKELLHLLLYSPPKNAPTLSVNVLF